MSSDIQLNFEPLAVYGQSVSMSIFFTPHNELSECTPDRIIHHKLHTMPGKLHDVVCQSQSFQVYFFASFSPPRCIE